MSHLHFERAAVVVGIVLMTACAGPTPDSPPATNRDTPTPPPASQKAQTPEEQRDAIRKARSEEAEFAKSLVAAVQAETRNDAWASQKEQELKTSFASSSGPRGVLKSVECRSSKCDLQFEVSTRATADSPAGPVAVFNQWIAASQSCGYTILAPEAEAIRIVMDCAQPSPKTD